MKTAFCIEFKKIRPYKEYLCCRICVYKSGSCKTSIKIRELYNLKDIDDIHHENFIKYNIRLEKLWNII